jgi:hypothetical protein
LLMPLQSYALKVATMVKVTMNLDDPDLDVEETDAAARRLLVQLRELDEVETVERVLDPKPPEGNKSLSGFLVGSLQAEVRPHQLKSFFGFLGARANRQALEIEIEVGDRKIKVRDLQKNKAPVRCIDLSAP